MEMGGAERLLIDLIQCMKGDFEVILVLISLKGALLKEVPANVIVEQASNPWSLFILIKKYKPAVFHSHLWRADLLGLVTAFLAGVPLRCTTRHSINYFSGIKKLLIPLDVLSLRLSSSVIAISNAVKNFYQRFIWYKGVNFEVIYNGINLERFQNSRREERENNKPLYFLTIASLTYKKGHVQFLEVLKELRDLDFEWHLIGEGTTRTKIEIKAKELKLENRIVFHGARNDIENFYQKADLFILPSLWEGFGLVLIEAMASGVPVFASAVDGVKEIVDDGRNGVLFDYSSLASENAQKLLSIIKNKNFQENLIKTGKKEILKYRDTVMKDKYIFLYKVKDF